MTLNSSINQQQREVPRIQPLSWRSFLLILIVNAMYYLAFHKLIPAYLEFTGQPYLIAYLWIWVGLMATVFFLSLLLYHLEGRPFHWKAFSARYRLESMPAKNWLWTLVVIIVAAGLYFGLSPTAEWLSTFPIFSPPPLAPAELRPGAAGYLTPGFFFGMPVRGQWWVLPIYFTGWVLNILGEEFFYRGWMLPRQEQSVGSAAWLINGTIFTFQHWMQPFNFLAIWPGALFMAWVVQRRQNTWIGIVQHGLMNFSLFVVLVRWVIG